MMAEDVEEVVEEVVIPDVFDDTTEKVEVEAKAEPAEKKEEVEEKTETEETQEVVKTTTDDKKAAGLQAAYEAERRKRQDLQRQLEAKEEVIPDPVTDPEGNAKYLLDKASDGDFKTLLKMDSRYLRKEYDDYDKMDGVFSSLIAEPNEDGTFNIINQQLYDEYKASDYPAEFAYKHAKTHLKVQEISSGDYDSNLEKEIEKRAEKKARAMLKDKGLTDELLPDLTNAPASASNTDQPVVIAKDYLWNDAKP